MSIYLEAAKLMDATPEDQFAGCCSRIYRSHPNHGTDQFSANAEVEAFCKLFEPDLRYHSWWGIQWSEDLTERKECRVLALLFMHQIDTQGE